METLVLRKITAALGEPEIFNTLLGKQHSSHRGWGKQNKRLEECGNVVPFLEFTGG